MMNNIPGVSHQKFCSKRSSPLTKEPFYIEQFEWRFYYQRTKKIIFTICHSVYCSDVGFFNLHHSRRVFRCKICRRTNSLRYQCRSSFHQRNFFNRNFIFYRNSYFSRNFTWRKQSQKSKRTLYVHHSCGIAVLHLFICCMSIKYHTPCKFLRYHTVYCQ